MRILVTGAAGYIGSVCTEVLIARGHSVIAIDDLSEGHREALHAQARFYQVNLHDHSALDSVFSENQIDAVMHFAALCSVEQSVKEPGAYYRANVAAGINLLDAMIRHGVKRFIFSSTAATYGEPEETPISEGHPTKPINPYGSSKLLFERVLREFKENSGLDYVVMRYFNAAGASENRGEDHHPETHILPILFEVALGQREAFNIYGTDYPTPDGTCIRDYIHVVDIAESHILALERISEVAGRVFNVGNSRGFSVREVIAAVERIIGRKIPVREAPRRPGDPADLVASSDRIRRDLGWSPRYSDLDSIIKTAWAWKQRYPKGYSPGLE
ncbi:MAG TPA: UDP-glucose 4-epimerase GalE [Candidatus Acidoferrales bacterium]|nr:UDP-glucose 4-epimerase GalE [Candidatus Acidoferrales bacterium]